MRIGILQCDDVPAALQAIHGNYPKMFIRLFEDIDPLVEFTIFRVIDGKYPSSVDECDAYITTGSRFGVNDNEAWVVQFQHFIAKLYAKHKKLIGICFGHQMMVKALGGEVVKSPKGWGVGVATAKIIQNKSWMDASVNEISLVVSHQDQIIVLPEDCEIIAGSDFCPLSMIQIGEHFLGIQGHPEFSKRYSQDLMNTRWDSIPGARIESGVESLALAVDDKLICRWLLNFLN